MTKSRPPFGTPAITSRPPFGTPAGRSSRQESKDSAQSDRGTKSLRGRATGEPKAAKAVASSTGKRASRPPFGV